MNCEGSVSLNWGRQVNAEVQVVGKAVAMQLLPNPHDPRDMGYASGRSEYSDGRLGTRVCRKEFEELSRLPDTLAFALMRNIWTERGDQAKKEIQYAFRSSNSIRKQYFFEMPEDKKRAPNDRSTMARLSMKATTQRWLGNGHKRGDSREVRGGSGGGLMKRRL